MTAPSPALPRPVGLAELIEREVLSWPGVNVGPHRFGGREYRVGHREIGHLHGQRVADLPFPRVIRDRLVADGRARPHHYLPATGWVSYYLEGIADVPGAVALFRLNYDRLRRAAAGGRPGRPPNLPRDDQAP